MQKYAKTNQEDQRAKDNLKDLEYIAGLMKDSLYYEVRLLDISTPTADYSPNFYNSKVVFVSARDTNKWQRNGWTGQPYTSLFIADKDVKGNLIDYEHFDSDINSKYNEGPCTFPKEMGVIYFTRNNYLDGKIGKDETNMVNLKIYKATQNEEDEWTNIEPFEYNSEDYSCGHPALSPQSRKLYFVSDMPGGFGGTDIYVCENNNGKWSKPKNLGSDINTAGNEMFPYVDYLDYLYFSSDGLLGMGGLDVFVAKEMDSKSAGMLGVENYEKKEGEMSFMVANMKYPINTCKDDFGLIIDEYQRGYLASNREGGVGDDDLYFFEVMNPPMANTDYLVVDEDCAPTKITVALNDTDIDDDLNPASVNVLTKLNNGGELKIDSIGDLYYQPLPNFNGADKVTYRVFDHHGFSDTSQLIITVLPVNDPPVAEADSLVVDENDAPVNIFVPVNDYDIDGNLDSSTVKVLSTEQKGANAKVDGTGNIAYAPPRDYFGTDQVVYSICDTDGACDIDTVFVTINEVKVEVGLEFEIRISYQLNKAEIKFDSEIELDRLIEFMTENGKINVEIGAHTDARGSAAYNMSLSQRRAQAAVDYLVKNGIVADRLTAKGYGEARIKNHCIEGTSCTDKEHAINRRTTVRVTGRN